MTISSEARSAGPFIGAGTTSAFSFAFKVFAGSDLQVIRTDTATGVDTVLTFNSDYTVALNSDQDVSPGGTVTLVAPLATGLNLAITSAIPALQPVSLTNQGGLYPSVINAALDRVTALVQQVATRLGRAIVAPFSDTASLALPSALLRANKMLTFDASGNVTASNLQPGTFAGVAKAGDTMTGPLVLPGSAVSALQAVPLQQVEAIVGWKNRLINAVGIINGRLFPGGATSGPLQYTVDRWRVVVSGQSVTWVLTNGALVFTCPAGGFEQVIEAQNLLPGTYCVNWQGTATCQVNGAGVAKGGTFVADGVSNYVVRFSSGTLSLPQVEPGTRPTAFEHRPVMVEQAMCRWYGESIVVNAVSSGFVQDYRMDPKRLNSGATVTVPSFGWTGSPGFSQTGQSTFRQTAYVATSGSGTLFISAEL